MTPIKTLEAGTLISNHPHFTGETATQKAKSDPQSHIACHGEDGRPGMQVGRLSSLELCQNSKTCLQSTGMWHGSGPGSWEEVGKESDPSNHLPDFLSHAFCPALHTHPPLGERKSVSSSSPAPNIALAFARRPGGSRSVSKALSRRRRERPRRRPALRQDELSHGRSRDRSTRLRREDLGGPRAA